MSPQQGREILRKRDENIETKGTPATDCLSEFGRERDRLQRFYHARSKGKIKDVAQNVVAIEKRQSSLINALAFIKEDAEKLDHPVQRQAAGSETPPSAPRNPPPLRARKKTRNLILREPQPKLKKRER